MGKETYSDATRLLITADGGGSNSSRSKLWKTELQQLANETGMHITVCHFPPGTSKWNKIELRLFSHISQNWRGKPLVSHEGIVNLIAGTTTSKGLKIAREQKKWQRHPNKKRQTQQMAFVSDLGPYWKSDDQETMCH